jgi:hypothetical protein
MSADTNHATPTSPKPLPQDDLNLLSEMKRRQAHYNSDKNNTVFAAAFIRALKNLSSHARGK